VTALWVCVHPISKKTAEQLLASGVVSHREELIQCIALHTHCGVLAGRTHGENAPSPELNSAGLNPAMGASIAAVRLTRTPTKTEGLGSNLNTLGGNV
jgi:hypothetical protein